MSYVYEDMGNISEQFACIENELCVTENSYGKAHFETAECYEQVYQAYYDLWMNEEYTDKFAELTKRLAELAKTLVEIHSELDDENDIETAHWMLECSFFIQVLGNKDECYLYLRKAIDIYCELLDDDIEWYDIYMQAAYNYTEFRDYEFARTMLGKATIICQVNDYTVGLTEIQEIMNSLV